MNIERANFTTPERAAEEALPERYRQPSALSTAGQVDRRHEGQHVVRMRDMQRDFIETTARHQKAAGELQSLAVAERQALDELKFQLFRAKKESQILAGDDPELTAKYALLDDDLFMRFRLHLHDQF